VPTIGIRDLKNNATHILRAVREERAEYVVTFNGRPVAVLRPYTEADTAAQRATGVEAYLARVEELAREVAAAWQGPASAAEAVAEQRR
jgi:prevent-host-death family protein